MRKAPDTITRVFSDGTLVGLADGQLLDRFASQGDADAFAVIVKRHGAMVLSVCRSTLGARDASDAEDAFQATFLVLLRRAGSFPLNGSLAGWLYRVARRVARQARIERQRRRRREQAVALRSTEQLPTDAERAELCQMVQQELAQLPERYRIPIWLCDVSGLTRDQAAEAIGCPPGTVAGRLARARIQLRERLISRGVSDASALPAAMAVSSEELTRLLRLTSQALVPGMHGEAAIKAAVGLLAARVMQGLLLTRLSVAVPLLATLAAVGGVSVVSGFRTDARPRDEQTQAAQIVTPLTPPTRPKPAESINPGDPTTADIFAGKVVNDAGEPLAGAKLYIVPQSNVESGKLPLGPGIVRAVTGADGRFRFSAKDLTFTSLDGLPARRRGLLIATAEGYGPDWMTTWGETGSSAVAHWDPVKGADLTLTLARADVPIRGRLLGPDGRPLAGAVVRLSAVHVPWKRNLSAHLEKEKGKEHDFGLGMTDYDRTLPTPAVLPGVAPEAVTNSDGRFQLQGLGRDQLARLVIRGPGVAEKSIEVMTRDADDLHVRPPGWRDELVTYGANFTLELEPGRTLTGVVRDKTSGAPLADVWVSAGLRAISTLETGQYPDATDANGRFTLTGLSADLNEAHYSRITGTTTRGTVAGFPQFEHQHIVLAVPKPGQPYFLAKGSVDEAGQAVVECPRGIPYRLTLRDEAGRPVEAEVTYSVIKPNPSFGTEVEYIQVQAGSPLSRAARQADGSYLGVALSGPGVVVAMTSGTAGYRPAHVDPKAFFAPGRTNWTAQDLITTYGNHDTLSVATFYGGAWINQHDYAAILLINPEEGSKPLELDATVVPDRPRQVTLLDPDGRPVIGATTLGLTYHPWDREPPLRTATFPITGLHPDRTRRITFFKEDRKLIGSLLARGDGDSPYTVRMQPWGTITGRLVDQEGKPWTGKPWTGASLGMDTLREFAAHDDPNVGVFPSTVLQENGRFRVDRIVPGQSYEATLYSGSRGPSWHAFAGVKVAPGAVRDLGELRIGTRERPGDANGASPPN